MRALTGLTLGVLALGAACRALPEIPAGTCGNHVIDEGEDCDGFARLGKECRAPGGVGQCHLDCSDATSGEIACPEGFGCDPVGVCRRPNDRFVEEPSGAVPGSAVRLTSGDFDGDGQSDVLAQSSPGSFLGFARLGIHYFDRNAALADSWITTQAFGSTSVLSLNDDGRSDLLLLQSAICAMLGEANRTITPRAYPSYLLQGSHVKVFSLLDRRVDNSSALAVLRQIGGHFQIERPSERQGERLEPVATFEGGLDSLAGDPVAAHVFADREQHPCKELTIAVRDSGELALYQLCERRDGVLHWKEKPDVIHLELDPPAEPSAGPLFADLDGNGHVDLLVATRSGPYAAFNDGTELGSLEPFELPDEVPEAFKESPIAAGDISGDGIADLILPRVFLISGARNGDISYRVAHVAQRGDWTRGLVADMNGDERLDALVTSASGPDIEFFLGTGTDRQNHFVVPTARPAERMVIGDFDGDTISDLAFVSYGDSDAEDDVISVAYGNSAGVPDHPVTIAHASRVTDLVSVADNDNETSADVFVLTELPDADATPRTGTLSILAGTPDRLFFSPILLTNFSSDGTLDEAESVAAIAGHFSDPAVLDLLAIGIAAADPGTEDSGIEFSWWSLPDFASGLSVPHKLGWEFDPRIEPLLLAPTSAPLSVTLKTADLDRDNLEEIVLAAPIEGETRCIIAWAKLEEASTKLGRLGQLVFDEDCRLEPQVEALDLDGDGAAELALVLGRDESASVRVLWNDGNGGFSLESSSVLPGPGGISSFALFRPLENAPLKYAYTTATGVHWGDVAGNTQSFGAPRTLEGFSELTGITAGDVNGDGVTDLAVADAGTLRILKAGLDER